MKSTTSTVHRDPAGADTTALRLDSVSKTYRSGSVLIPAVKELDLRIASGKVTAITGPSGSGKSTILHLAAGMVAPTSGRISIGGVDVTRASVAEMARLRRTSVGIVFQDYNLLPTLTALENVTLPLELEGTSLRSARATAEDALRRVGIDDPLDRYPDDLSGGQQQRVAIARAIAVPRTLLLADEPTGALDSVTGDRVMDLLVELADAGTAVVVVTHEPRVAAHADRVLTLRDGRKVADTGSVR